MSEKQHFRNLGGVEPEEVNKIIKLTQNLEIGGSENFDKKIYQYTEKDFAELFGENIDKDLKEKIIKNIENEIENFEKELIKLEKIKIESFQNGKLDEMIKSMFNYDDVKNAIKSREDKLDLIINCN